jgi:sigma-54 dependent transcriptional regulator, acetoin dehydrogenase operon transcriptional activator AcoR
MLVGSPSMLILSAPDDHLWENFQKGHSIARNKAGKLLRTHWERSRELGVKADGPAAPEGVSGGDLAVRRDRAEAVFAEGSPLLEQFTQELSTRNVIAVLTDSDGVVLVEHGGGKFKSTAVKTRLVEGARWDEATRGTNAIGTVLSLGTPVGVIGAAHFERVNHGLFCYASPIRDVLGRIVAVLDVSGKVTDDHSSFAFSIEATTVAVERILRVRAYAAAMPGGLRLLESMLERCAVGAILVEHSGAVRTLNEKAANLLGAAATTLTGRTCESVLGYTFATLRDESIHRGGRSLRVETDRGACYAEALPIGFGTDETFAVLIYLEPEVSFGALPKRERERDRGDREPSSKQLGPALSSLRGSDPHFALARKAAEGLALTDTSFLIVGESGTGKKRVARAVHAASARQDEPFTLLTASTSTDLEMMIFGRGSKKGPAIAGQLDQSEGGTLYVDEIQDFPKVIQTALAKALSTRTYKRIGDAELRQLHGRLVFASTLKPKDLLTSLVPELRDAMGSQIIALPSVRDRGDKVELAFNALVEGESSSGDPWELADDARAVIASHAWPGNLGELVFVMQEAKGLCGVARLVSARDLYAAMAKWNARTRFA